MSTPKICVLTASVATTRCQHYWCTFQGKVYLLGECKCKHTLGVDTSALRFGGVQSCGHLCLKVRRCKKLVLELETHAHTELFRIHEAVAFLILDLSPTNACTQVHRSKQLNCHTGHQKVSGIAAYVNLSNPLYEVKYHQCLYISM